MKKKIIDFFLVGGRMVTHHFEHFPPQRIFKLFDHLDRASKNVKFGLLAEIRGGGRGLKGIQRPNVLSGTFLLFNKNLDAPKHEKNIKIKM